MSSRFDPARQPDLRCMPNGDDSSHPDGLPVKEWRASGAAGVVTTSTNGRDATATIGNATMRPVTPIATVFPNRSSIHGIAVPATASSIISVYARCLAVLHPSHYAIPGVPLFAMVERISAPARVRDDAMTFATFAPAIGVGAAPVGGSACATHRLPTDIIAVLQAMSKARRRTLFPIVDQPCAEARSLPARIAGPTPADWPARMRTCLTLA